MKCGRLKVFSPFLMQLHVYQQTILFKTIQTSLFFLHVKLHATMYYFNSSAVLSLSLTGSKGVLRVILKYQQRKEFQDIILVLQNKNNKIWCYVIFVLIFCLFLFFSNQKRNAIIVVRNLLILYFHIFAGNRATKGKETSGQKGRENI